MNLLRQLLVSLKIGKVRTRTNLTVSSVNQDLTLFVTNRPELSLSFRPFYVGVEQASEEDYWLLPIFPKTLKKNCGLAVHVCSFLTRYDNQEQ